MTGSQAKICGLSTPASVQVAVDGDAAYVGFVFYGPSPRNVSAKEAADLVRLLPDDVKSVGVFVNPDDDFLSDILEHVDLDIVQLHGAESPERVADVKQRFGKTVMKAIAVAGADDIDKAKAYENVADMLLFDAKAPKDLDNALPGGNGLAFDWQLIAGSDWQVPWMLSGGLDVENVTEALHISGAHLVDVSSGVESAPGIKDEDKIKAFLKAVNEQGN